MHVRFDGGGVLDAATGLRGQADDAADLGRRATDLSAGLTEPSLDAAVRLLGDVCADVLAVSALDLELLASLVRSGVTAYGQVEHRAMRVSA